MKSKIEDFKGRAAVVLLVGILVGLTAASPVAAEWITWETDYAFIRFNWSGTWDTSAYWAYGMYVLDIPDWSYLFAVYGMGWTNIWGPGFWGTDGVWGSEDKITVHISPGYGNTFFPDTNTIRIDPNFWGSLDLVSGGWVNTLCTAGRAAAFFATESLVHRYIRYENPSYEDGLVDFLSEALGYQTANVLWPWGDHTMVQGYDVSTLNGIRAGYQYYHTYPNYYGWYYTAWGWAANHQSPYHYTTAGDASLFTCFGAGYLFLDYDHQFNGAADAGGASSLSPVATLLNYMRNDPGHDGWNEGFLASYGHGADMSGGGWSGVPALDPTYNQMHAWLVNLMWGFWFHYGC